VFGIFLLVVFAIPSYIRAYVVVGSRRCDRMLDHHYTVAAPGRPWGVSGDPTSN